MGSDATNDLTYLCLQATKDVKTHQPGLSVRIHPGAPDDFVMAVCDLVAAGTGFPAIHNDTCGTQMMLQNGLTPEDARDWNNCGCVVPHFRKVGEWTATVNINFVAALEYAINQGKARITGEQMGLEEKPVTQFTSYEEVEEAFYKQFKNLIRHSVIGSTIAQQVHTEVVSKTIFISVC